MSYFPRFFSEIASIDASDLDSVAVNPPRKRKWNRLLYTLLSFPNHTHWNVVVLITAVINFYFVSICFCFVPHYMLNTKILPLYAALDLPYLFNFILLLLHRFGNKITRHLKVKAKPGYIFLLLDLLTLLTQLTFLVQFFNTSYNYIFLYCRLVTFLRLHNLLFFTRVDKQLQEKRWKWFWIENLVLFLTVLHALNLIWYFIACKNYSYIHQLKWESTGVRNATCHLNTLVDWYFMTTYANMQIIFNVGFGDFYPVTNLEIIWFIVILLGGYFLSVFFISKLCWLMINSRFHAWMYSQKIDYINKYIEDISNPTKKSVKEYYKNLWEKQNGINTVSIFHYLPDSLKMDVTYDLNCGLLHRSVLLKTLPIHLKRRICLAMKHIFLSPGEAVYYKYVVKKYMVCVDEGLLEVLYEDDDHSPIIFFKSGTILGETSLFFNIPAKATVRAAKYTELKILEKVDFIKIMVDYPNDLWKLRSSIEKRFSLTLKDNTIKSVESQTLKKLKMNLYGSRAKLDANIVKDYKNEFLTLYRVSSEINVMPRSFVCVTNKFPWILQENSSLLIIWKMLVTVIQIVLCLLYPYYAVFERKVPYYLYIYGILADLACVIDVIIQCTTTIHFRNKIVTRLPEIIDHRLNNWKFYCDVFSLFPIEVWAYLVGNRVTRDRYYDLLKLNRILRVWRVNELFKLRGCRMRQTPLVLWILKTIIYTSLFTYYVASVFYLNACMYEICDEDSWFFQKIVENARNAPGNNYTESPLLTSMYFTVMTGFHTGLGDILPTSYRDIAIVLTTICVGMLLKSYLVAKLVSSLFLSDYCKKKEDVLFSFNSLIRYFNINDMNSSRIKQFFLINSHCDDVYGERIVQKTASNVLETELHTAKMRNILSEIPLFKMVDSYFLAIIRKDARIFKLPANEILYYYGDPLRVMYVLQKGLCGLYNSENCLVQTLGSGNQFGMMEMVLGMLKKHTVVAITDCIMVSVEYKSFLETIKKFPKEYEVIKGVIKSPNFVQMAKDLETDTDISSVNYRKVQHNSFLSASKTWSEYWHTYGAKLGFFWFLGFLFIPLTINPNGNVLRTWCTIRCILVTIHGIALPLLVMTPPLFHELYWVIFACQVSLYLDMYILLHVAYYNEKALLKTHPLYTAWYYLTHSFLLDLVAAFPIAEILLYANPTHSAAHNFTHTMSAHDHHCKWRLISLVQFHRVYKLLNYFENNTWKIYKTIRVLKTAMVTLIIVILLITLKMDDNYNYIKDNLKQESSQDASTIFYHPLNYTPPHGKLIYLNGHNEEKSMFLPISISDTANKYVTGIYSVTNFITNTGLENIDEIPWLAGIIILVFMGFIVFTHFVSMICTLFLQKETATIDFRRNVAHLMAFLKKNAVEKDQRDKVLNHLNLKWEYTRGLNYLTMLHSLNLNNSLNEDILISHCKNALKHSALCHDLDTTTLRLIINEMNVECFSKGELIIRYKDVISNMYVIVSGQADILDEREVYVTTIGPGGIFGNIRRSNYGCSPIYVVARRNVNLCVISSQTFFSIIKYYPLIHDRFEASLFHNPSFIIPSSPDVESERDQLWFWKDMESDDESALKNRTSYRHVKSCMNFLQLCLPCRWFKFSISPNHSIVKVTDCLVFWASFINMFTIPYVFIVQQKNYLALLDLALEPIFYLKMLINLHKAYSNYYGNYIKSNWKITQKYFNSRTKVFWDIVPNLPVCLLCFVFVQTKWFYFYSCLRLLQLARIYYILEYFNMKDKRLTLNCWLLPLKLLTLYVVIVHLISCCWYMIACPFGKCKPETWIFRYSKSLSGTSTPTKLLLSYYYIISTITTTGIGDILPDNCLEMIFTIIVMLLGKISTAILIGGILRFIYVSYTDLVQFEYKANSLKTFLKNHQLSDYQMKKVWQHLQNWWKYENGCCTQKLLRYIPYDLSCDILYGLYGHHLEDSFIFRNIDDSLLKQICLKLKPITLFRGEYIVKYGDRNSCMYFIHKGDVTVLTKHSDLTETQHVLLHPNDMFGVSQGVNQETVHHFTYRTSSSVVEILVLCFDSWSHLLPFFPSDKKLIFTRIQKSFTKV